MSLYLFHPICECGCANVYFSEFVFHLLWAGPLKLFFELIDNSEYILCFSFSLKLEGDEFSDQLLRCTVNVILIGFDGEERHISELIMALATNSWEFILITPIENIVLIDFPVWENRPSEAIHVELRWQSAYLTNEGWYVSVTKIAWQNLMLQFEFINQLNAPTVCSPVYALLTVLRISWLTTFIMS